LTAAVFYTKIWSSIKREWKLTGKLTMKPISQGQERERSTTDQLIVRLVQGNPG